MQHEYVSLEPSRREIGERAVFRFLVKSAAFVLVGLLEWLIFSSLPPAIPLPMKAILWFALTFTIVMLSIALTCRSKVVQMHAMSLFGVGAFVLVVGTLTGLFPVN